ncbi:Similar to imidazole glycerol phosphate synthase cyclase subunit (LPS cluster) [hydrothermal vent metagenome]|uniref:imidazole glycerol-phosphate synthase n=1 Tax=hydrothermal vent metagenome TaxID=652676 RepID=A0A3B0YSW4_9ZZZZ
MGGASSEKFRRNAVILRPRVIPCLLVKNRGLVKTVKFTEPKYVGDPINAVKIFNEKGSDELMVLDIDATVEAREPDYKMIKNLAAECRMPLCYGGGVTSLEQFKKIISLGVEKVAISAAAIKTPELIARAAEVVGNQSVVVVLDVKKRRFGGKYDVYTHNGLRACKKEVTDLAIKFEALGAGELVINSIDRDGTMQGYDIKLIEQIRNVVSIPVTALGGAGSLEHINELVTRFGVIGAAAGSLFVFKGKYRAVLINYPDQQEKDNIVAY